MVPGGGRRQRGQPPLGPQVIPGVVEKLFEEISLIQSSPATTSTIRYTNEGTATNAAAGWGLKPPSNLALSTVDEPVRKVATVVSISDELFDDAPQVQQYLNSRLALFVRLEYERQVLRGAGGGSNELVGIFGRAGINYGIGSDSPLVGPYKTLVNTRGSSNLAPSGIVMHPTAPGTLSRDAEHAKTESPGGAGEKDRQSKRKCPPRTTQAEARTP
jgi:HK97 family phage major capsid protein